MADSPFLSRKRSDGNPAFGALWHAIAHADDNSAASGAVCPAVPGHRVHDGDAEREGMGNGVASKHSTFWL